MPIKDIPLVLHESQVRKDATSRVQEGKEDPVGEGKALMGEGRSGKKTTFLRNSTERASI